MNEDKNKCSARYYRDESIFLAIRCFLKKNCNLCRIDVVI